MHMFVFGVLLVPFSAAIILPQREADSFAMNRIPYPRWGIHRNSVVGSYLKNDEDAEIVIARENSDENTRLESCSLEQLVENLNFDGLERMLSLWAAKQQRKPKDVIRQIARRSGFMVRERKLPRSRMDLQEPQPSPLESGISRHLFLDHEQTPDVLVSFPVNTLGDGTTWNEDAQDTRPMALLLLLEQNGAALSSSKVTLFPTTSFFDVLLSAREQFLNSFGPEASNPFDFLVNSNAGSCLHLTKIGHLRATPSNPLIVSVVSKNMKVRWQNVCIPKISDLLIYSHDTLIVAPSAPKALL